MSVKIRLVRMGRKKKPIYRIVAADTSAPRNGKFIEVVGNYDPNHNPAKVVLKTDKINEWLNKGAIATDTVKALIKKSQQEQQSA